MDYIRHTFARREFQASPPVAISANDAVIIGSLPFGDSFSRARCRHIRWWYFSLLSSLHGHASQHARYCKYFSRSQFPQYNRMHHQFHCCAFGCFFGLTTVLLRKRRTACQPPVRAYVYGLESALSGCRARLPDIDDFRHRPKILSGWAILRSLFLALYRPARRVFAMLHHGEKDSSRAFSILAMQMPHDLYVLICFRLVIFHNRMPRFFIILYGTMEA